MAGIFTADGKYIPVTVVKTGPCVVTQIKTIATDGYSALQLGFSEKKESRVNRPLRGHFKKSGNACFEFLREFDVKNSDGYKLGQIITSEIFKVGERVDVIGTTKGRGFSGVIRRHGFHGGSKTHGGHCHRIPGSIGCSAWPSRILKGKKMPGQYGNTRKTVKNLEVVGVRPEDNLILLKGAIPGSRSGFVLIHKNI
jgi:large subunit ribosomal protein L3